MVSFAIKQNAGKLSFLNLKLDLNLSPLGVQAETGLSFIVTTICFVSHA